MSVFLTVTNPSKVAPRSTYPYPLIARRDEVRSVEVSFKIILIFIRVRARFIAHWAWEDDLFVIYFFFIDLELFALLLQLRESQRYL